MTFPRFAILSLALAAIATLAHAQTTLSSLNGKYVLAGHGDRYVVLNLIDEPLTDVGYLVFDGAGNVTAGKIFENVNNTDTVLTEAGAYIHNADDSFTVTLTGTQTRRFNVFADDISQSTGIAQAGDGDDVGYGDGAGDDIAVHLRLTQDPPGGYVQGNLASTWSGEFAGVNSSGQKDSGVMEIAIDANGNISGRGHESDDGTNHADTIGGQVTISLDGTYAGDIVINGAATPLEGILLGFQSVSPSPAQSTPGQLSPQQTAGSWFPDGQYSSWGENTSLWTPQFPASIL